MFVSVILDPGTVDSAKDLSEVLASQGFHKIQRSCWEHTALKEEHIAVLKTEIDRVTDYYDTVRIYQYPVQGVLAISQLSKKKWRKILLKA